MQESLSEEVKPFRRPDHPVDAAFVNRWSPRAFAAREVPGKLLWSVLECARWAASSRNEQPWRFAIARTAADRERFVEFLFEFNQQWAKHAPVLVVVLAKTTFAHDGSANRTHQYDTGTASGYMTLGAHLNGLIAHGMGGFDVEKARAALRAPADFEPMAVYAIGFRGDSARSPASLLEREVPSPRRPLHESVVEGDFGRPCRIEADAAA